MISRPADHQTDSGHHAGSVWQSEIDAPLIDSETAALIRAWMCPLIDDADSWSGLARCLAARGYALAIRSGRLVLLQRDTGTVLCSLRFMGTSLRELSKRFGRPMVRPVPGATASGDILT